MPQAVVLQQVATRHTLPCLSVNLWYLILCKKTPSAPSLYVYQVPVPYDRACFVVVVQKQSINQTLSAENKLFTMSRWFRSEPMEYISLIVNEDAAHDCLADLGKLSVVQFTDVSNISPFSINDYSFSHIT